MNIEDLSKSQIILLTLLVSFVTSIATGIITVTLLEQAPPTVTQSVNRIVQNTIEKIVPAEGEKTIETVIIKEEDLVADAISQNIKSLVAIRASTDAGAGQVIGTGFLVSKDGVVITDATFVADQTQYYVASSGVAYEARVVAQDPRGFAILKVAPTKNDQGDFKSFGFSVLGDSKALTVGQTVVAPSSLDGESLAVAKGTISRIVADPATIELAWSLGRASAGSPLLDTDGAVVGVIVAGGTAIPSAVITAVLDTTSTAE